MPALPSPILACPSDVVPSPTLVWTGDMDALIRRLRRTLDVRSSAESEASTVATLSDLSSLRLPGARYDGGGTGGGTLSGGTSLIGLGGGGSGVGGGGAGGGGPEASAGMH